MLNSNDFRVLKFLIRYTNNRVSKNDACRRLLSQKKDDDGADESEEINLLQHLKKSSKDKKPATSAPKKTGTKVFGPDILSLLTNLKSRDSLKASEQDSSTEKPTLKLDQKTGHDKEKQEADVEKILGKQTVSAAEAVAKILGGEKVKSDILKKLMDIETESSAPKADLSQTLSSMTLATKKHAPAPWTSTSVDDQIHCFRESFKFDRRHPDHQEDRRPRRYGEAERPQTLPSLDDVYARKRAQLEMEDRRKLDLHKQQTQKMQQELYAEINLLDGPRLNIFDLVAEKPQTLTDAKSVWDKLDDKHLKWLTAQSPRNGFEEMINWTDQKKMFPYPIDNEFGFYEKHVGFHQHVFLDHLLKDGFPSSGPIRAFMELVINGLSKNPYMTVEKKIDHVDWYRKYFENRSEEIDKMVELDREEMELKKLR